MRLTLVAALVVVTGCGRSEPPVADPSQSQPSPAREQNLPVLAGDDGKESSPPVAPSTLTTPAGVAQGDEDLSKVVPDFKMKSQEWKGVEDRAKYKGKVIELVGEVIDLEHTDTTPYDTYLHVNDPAATNGIGATAVIKGKDAWKMVLPGQTVTLRFRYDPKDGDRPFGAQIISVSGKPFGSMTVDELVAAARDPDEANERFGRFVGPRLLLTGKVLSIRADTISPSKGRVEFVMTPAGTTPPLVVGVAVFTMDPFFAQVKEGQTIKVLGRLQAEKDETRFFAFALLEAK